MYCRSKMRFFVVLVSLIAINCTPTAKMVIQTSKTNESNELVEAVTKIVTSCYENQAQTLGLVGKVPETFLRTLWSQDQCFPAISMYDESHKVHKGHKAEKSSFKLQLFVVGASTSTQLKESLVQIKNSRWWNHMASFLIIDWTTASESRCPKSSEFLLIAWEMNLLDATFLCLDEKNTPLMYTYNPYSSRAPISWQPAHVLSGKNGHPWTLMVQKFQDHEKFCDDLKFVKTNDLEGYEIRATVKDIPEVWQTDANKTGIDSFTGCDGTIAQYIFRALNATPNVKTYQSTEGPGFSSGKVDDILTELDNDNSELILNPRGLMYEENSTMTYPSSYVRVHIATQQRGHQSQLSKIMSVIDGPSRFGLLIVAIATLLIFKFFHGQNLSSAAIDLCRIVCNSSLLKLPTKLSSRIYLTTLFFLYVTILGIYQGTIASVLTKQKSLKNVDTLKDLGELGYTVYGHKLLESVFSDPVFHGRYVGINTFFCLEHVMRDPRAACVSTKTFIARANEKIDAESKLHSSRDEILNAKMIYAIRKDWPLERRLNDIVMTLFETDIIRKTVMREYEELFAAEIFYERLAEKEKFNVIVLDELIFAFVILGFGLICASICFIVEVAIYGP